MHSELNLAMVAKQAGIAQGDYYGQELARQLRVRGDSDDKRLWRLDAGVRSMCRRPDDLTQLVIVRHGLPQVRPHGMCTLLNVTYWSPHPQIPADSQRAWFAKLQVAFIEDDAPASQHRYQLVDDGELAFAVSSRQDPNASLFTGWPLCDIIMPLVEAAWGRHCVRSLSGRKVGNAAVVNYRIYTVQGFLDHLVMRCML